MGAPVILNVSDAGGLRACERRHCGSPIPRGQAPSCRILGPIEKRTPQLDQRLNDQRLAVLQGESARLGNAAHPQRNSRAALPGAEAILQPRVKGCLFPSPYVLVTDNAEFLRGC